MSTRLRNVLLFVAIAVAIVPAGRLLENINDGFPTPPATAVDSVTSTTQRQAATTTQSPPDTSIRASDPVSDLPVASVQDLPTEVSATLALVEAGGPYPYDEDDGDFGNREALLPDRFEGYYREYTVDTPGSDDRGARRLIVGGDGEVYYTDDHYESFVEVVDAHL